MQKRYTINDTIFGRRQLTQEGWDGSFVGIRPSGMNVQQGDEGVSTGSFATPSFAGFNGPNEQGGNGPTMGPGNAQPTSGSSFPGDGTGFDGFNAQNER